MEKIPDNAEQTAASSSDGVTTPTASSAIAAETAMSRLPDPTQQRINDTGITPYAVASLPALVSQSSASVGRVYPSFVPSTSSTSTNGSDVGAARPDRIVSSSCPSHAQTTIVATPVTPDRVGSNLKLVLVGPARKFEVDDGNCPRKRQAERKNSESEQKRARKRGKAARKEANQRSPRKGYATRSKRKQAADPRDNHRMGFRKYRDRTYAEVKTNNEGYRRWALKQRDPCGGLVDFLGYLGKRVVERDAGDHIMNFGKHRGLTFHQVLQVDPGYGTLAVFQPHPSDPRFAAYVAKHAYSYYFGLGYNDDDDLFWFL